MAEYWKSTPKYWCKFCSIYVRDTKLERANHEATGRHQSNIQKSLKGIHREQEQAQRQQQFAKDEVARLNGLVGGSSSKTTAAAASPGVGPKATASDANDARPGSKPTFSRAGEKKVATKEDRQKQIDQLIAMGVPVPQELRADMALTGEWQVVNQRILTEDGEEVKPPSGLSTGVHKRKLDEEEEERIADGEMITKKKGWGKTFKSFPGKMAAEDVDLDALFGAKKPAVKEEDEEESEVKTEDGVKVEPQVKEEAEKALPDISTEEEAKKQESEAAAPAVVFKKRKKIAR